MTIDQNKIETIIGNLTPEERQAVFAKLKKSCHVHPLELEWHASAEMILDAIAESADLTQRGVKGVIADRSFHKLVVPKLVAGGWTSNPIPPDLPYDADLSRGGDRVTVQVKMQRRKAGVPLQRLAGGGPVWVVEVQKTRNGKDKDGKGTRAYAYGQFDVLAVNLYASCSDWSRYIYTPAKFLRPRKADASLIDIHQPVSQCQSGCWTDDFEECVDWLMGDEKRCNPSFDPAPRAAKPAKHRNASAAKPKP